MYLEIVWFYFYLLELTQSAILMKQTLDSSKWRTILVHKVNRKPHSFEAH